MTFAEQAQAVTPESFREMVREAAEANGIELFPFHPMGSYPFRLTVGMESKYSVGQLAEFITKAGRIARASIQDDLLAFACAASTGFVNIVFEYDETFYTRNLELADIWRKSCQRTA